MNRYVRVISIIVMASSMTATIISEVALLPNITRCAFVFTCALLAFLINEAMGLE